ncbi:unnamed protein product [Orchesella dallaii]|uniref:NEDD8 ultimate buster 1 n=1 Tax=Orchesella dallaii TaxID=48710 RepID=A0ABP1QKI0_9HEXA
MSSTNLAENALTARLRDRLNLESTKLWLEPFFDPVTQTPKDAEVIALGSRYAVELELAESEVIQCMFALQRHAIEKIAERETFKSTGQATIRIRYSGQLTADEKKVALNVPKLTLTLSTINGKDLKDTIAAKLNVAGNRLKLISAGRVIDENKMLEAQNLKNGSQIMALFISTDKETYQETEDRFKQLEDIKDSADYLASSERSDVYSLQVADQSGKPLDLPEAERKALAVALALHDKGRSALKIKDFSKALVFLLEADTVYSQCQSQLLEMVDNYGLLNLDIAWCYLSLQSIAELPEAESRLQKCERALKRSYGEDMERVVALKGSTGWEAALFVRLHLLQAIAAYHLGQIEKSRFLMTRAETELGRLKVSDDKLAELINMGYKEDESRMALRATYGDASSAVDWIIRRREEKLQIKQQEKENRQKRKLQKQLGNCDNGQPINTRLFLQMKEMGFSPTMVTFALRRANNDMNIAIQLLGDNDFLRQARENIVIPSTQDGPSTSSAATAEAIAAASAVAEQVRPTASQQELLQNLADQLFENNLLDEFSMMNEAEKEKSQKAYESLSKDTCSESEYIDLTLSAEAEYLEHYKTLIITIQ